MRASSLKTGLLLAALLWPQLSYANLFDVFGAGARAQAMGGATTATVADYTAAFTNPAGLPDARNALSFGVTGTFNRTSILLMPRPSGYDPPAYSLRGTPRADTEDPTGVVGFTAGFSVKIFSDDFALGTAIFAPASGFSSNDSHFNDEREQYFSNALHFELMGDRLGSEIISVGLGYRFRPWLSMGLGMLVLPQSSTITQVYTPNAADPSDVDLNVKIEQGARRAINAGVMLKPADWLQIGVTFQDEIFFQIAGHSDVQLVGEEDQDPSRQIIDLVGHYSPAQITGAVALFDEARASASLEATFNAWSNYLDAHGASPGFDDTVDIKLGIELPREKSTARFGLAWQPSPIPEQTGRTNYIDNDRFALSAGGGRDIEFFGQDITLDFSLQVQWMVTKTTHKRSADGRYPACTDGETALCDEVPDQDEDNPLVRAQDTLGLQTGNPGFPGYTHGGYVVSTGFDLKWRF